MHSHITHLYALLETAKEQGVPECYVHFFGDGRDTAPRSANKYAEELLEFMDKLQYGKIATIVGRYYAMDRDKRWERVETAVKGLVNGDGEKVDDAVKAIEKRYEQDETDEFLKPIILGGEASRIKGKCDPSSSRTCVPMRGVEDDTLFFFNYRSDRMREIVSIFGVDSKPVKVQIPSGLVGCTTVVLLSRKFDGNYSTSLLCRDTTPNFFSLSPSLRKAWLTCSPSGSPRRE